MNRVVLVAVVSVLMLSACGGETGLLGVSDERIGQPTGPNAALYFTVSNEGDTADELIGASTDAAASVELHETTMGDDGTMGMQAVNALEVPAGESLVLEPGGYHLMLVDVERMDLGETVEVTLTWEIAGDMTIEAAVVEPGDTMGHEDMEMGEGGDG